MAKKEKLDNARADRLEKLLKEWEKSGGKIDYLSNHEKVTVLDLRLLLENPSPLRDLMCQVMDAYLRDKYKYLTTQANFDQKQPITCTEDTLVYQDESQALAQLQDDLRQNKSELVLAKSYLQQTKFDLKTCSSQVETLRKKEEDYKQKIKDLQERFKNLQDEMTATKVNSNANSALYFLRNDTQIAKIMGLADLVKDNTQALIKTVAVLAQIDNLKRLWETLKERCENEKRSATDNELELLRFSLDWNNHNWQSLPYRLIEIAPASRYDYESQSRSRHITKGETVVAMLLPGIADGSGKVLCKVLVQTK